MPVFYTQNISNNTIELDENESRHLFKVLRLQNGEKVTVIDGKGNQYECIISEAHPKKTQLRIENTLVKKREFGIHLAVAPTKNINRWEWFLEKATEIGIDEISPIICQHSERTNLKNDRQKKILIAAMKQSGKAQLPKLNEMIELKHFLEKNVEGNKYIAHCKNEISKMNLSNNHLKGEKAVILIGPEGDFSDEEILTATERGYKAVTLSESRLRTETAAIVACHAINLINE